MSETKLNRTDLIRAVSTDTGFTIKDVTAVLDALEGVTTAALKEGKAVAVLGGKLYAARTEAREGVKPGTTERIQIPSKTRARFKAGTQLAAELN